MRRATLTAFVLLTAVGASACGGAPAATTVTTAAPSTTTTAEAPTTTVPEAGVGSTAPTTTAAPATTTTVPRVRPEGRDAPDFTLALGEGGSFTLSEEHRPVFLLFWAEW